MHEINRSKYLEAKELAEYLDIDYGTLRNLMRDKDASLPPCVRIGKRRFWQVSVVEDWLSKNLEHPSGV